MRSRRASGPFGSAAASPVIVIPGEATQSRLKGRPKGSRRMSRKELPVETVAEAYLALLAERGVEYLFANAGTDFAPIVEAYAKAAHTGTANAEAADRDAREPRRLDGARLCDRLGQGAGGDGACQRRHRQRAVRRAQRGARERADPVHRRPLAADRGGAARRARHLHPLGAGDVRPGRHAARVGQVGLRAAQRRAARNRGRPRPGDRDQPAGRAGLSDLAARGAGRAAARVRL